MPCCYMGEQGPQGAPGAPSAHGLPGPGMVHKDQKETKDFLAMKPQEYLPMMVYIYIMYIYTLYIYIIYIYTLYIYKHYIYI